jgi:hypothetical protein
MRNEHGQRVLTVMVSMEVDRVDPSPASPRVRRPASFAEVCLYGTGLFNVEAQRSTIGFLIYRMGDRMRRREFISLICGIALPLPSFARAQTGKIPRVGILAVLRHKGPTTRR